MKYLTVIAISLLIVSCSFIPSSKPSATLIIPIYPDEIPITRTLEQRTTLNIYDPVIAAEEFIEECIITDPNRLLEHDDPNDFVSKYFDKQFDEWEVKYKERIVKYEEIISQSDIPVVITSLEDFIDNFFLKHVSLSSMNSANSTIYGMYIHESKVTGWPKQFIFINESISADHKMSTFFHEQRHHICMEDNCICMNVSSLWLKESHALQAELKQAMEYGLVESLEASVGGILIYVVDTKQPLHYRLAAMHVRRKSIWTDSIKYLEETRGKRLIPLP